MVIGMVIEILYHHVRLAQWVNTGELAHQASISRIAMYGRLGDVHRSDVLAGSWTYRPLECCCGRWGAREVSVSLYGRLMVREGKMCSDGCL
jgi:hypothetical protein